MADQVADTPAPHAVGDGLTDRRAMDRLFGAYLLVAGAALAFPGRGPWWPALALLHLLGAAWAFGLVPSRLVGPVRPPTGRVVDFLHDWYPLVLIPFLYAELAPLNLVVHGGHYFDPWIQRADAFLFGLQPSYVLSRSFPYLAVSEPLHAAYLSYYFIIYGPPLLLYALGRRGDFRRLVFPLMLTFFVHYLFFIYFPVQGPRYIFAAPGGHLAEGPVYQLAHRVLEAGSSRGAAFPSSHVAVTTAQTLLVYRFLPRLTPLVAVLAAGLAFGAVYGGFHYATDAIVGFVLGVLLILLAPTAKRLLVPAEAR